LTVRSHAREIEIETSFDSLLLSSPSLGGPSARDDARAFFVHLFISLTFFSLFSSYFH